MGIFDIFKRKSKKEQHLSEPLFLGDLHTDIHSHLIPGIDDGVKTMEDSMLLITELSKLGYKKLVTTPHIMNDYYKNTPEIINAGLADVRKEIAARGIDIEIEAAAEYMLDDGFEDKMKDGRLLTFGDNYLLVEQSYMTEYPRLAEVFFYLQTNGYKVVLAHPERYTYWHHDFQNYHKLIERGIYLQININSLTGWYSHGSKIIAQKLINRDMISFLGSDMHNPHYMEELKKSRYSHSLSRIIDSDKILNSSI